ncbi:tRNA-uridine aminocarboxypropyltransferase [Noviherbaspirillum sp. Root189]|uniref:tRNA-uridine aminocarboxypropyltransferase n=1 Tax=Noviherbaspirillum sp. Root189 TaxID=1736487 RepID=UPI00070EEE74|nr:tRNA-uridine aminocarboxypropyltransferase [Noviherbaspirillum sp. Root189]KRB89929.1 hypothetical protein ASE07_17480 [Noviherbaspirillum sp. Root189]
MTPSPDQQPDPGRRAECPHCLRAQSACICHWIVPVQSRTEVLILQHPMETRHAKGSARLLHLSLPGSQLVVGESFSEEQLHALLYAPFPDARTDVASCHPCRRQTLLLYPDTAGQASGSSHRKEVVSDNAARLRLVVLDGTWRKSRKMLYLNPMLQELPRLALQAAAPSQYRIRKAHLPDQLSTLEATCHALAQLEQDSARYAPVLQAFDGFVAEQLRYRD